MHSVASTDGLAACHVCKRGFIWLMWATGQDNLPCSVRRGPRGTAGWRARERLWFISAPGTHLVGLVQGCGTRGEWEAAGVLPVSWASGVIARRGVRVAAADVGIYIMTLCARGRKWNQGSAETLSFPPHCCPRAAPKGWHGESLRGLRPGVCRDRRTRLVAGMSRPRLSCRIPETPTSLVFSASAPFFSPPSSPLWWGEVCCSPQLCRNAVRMHEITSLNPGPTRPRSGISIKLSHLWFLWTVVPWLFYLPQANLLPLSSAFLSSINIFSDCLRLQSKYSQRCPPSVLLKPWFRNSILISLKKRVF